jgi:hypothetical protein
MAWTVREGKGRVVRPCYLERATLGTAPPATQRCREVLKVRECFCRNIEINNFIFDPLVRGRHFPYFPAFPAAALLRFGER